MADAETLFFVHHSQTQVFELDVFLQQSVGADDDIYAAVCQPFNHFLLFFGCTEATQDFNPDGEGAESFAKSHVVLLGQDGGGNQNGHLHAIVHRLESGPKSNFCLAVANVPAD